MSFSFTIYPSIFLSLYLHLSLYQSISVYRYIYLSVYQSISIYQSMCLSLPPSSLSSFFLLETKNRSYKHTNTNHIFTINNQDRIKPLVTTGSSYQTTHANKSSQTESINALAHSHQSHAQTNPRKQTKGFTNHN